MSRVERKKQAIDSENRAAEEQKAAIKARREAKKAEAKKNGIGAKFKAKINKFKEWFKGLPKWKKIVFVAGTTIVTLAIIASVVVFALFNSIYGDVFKETSEGYDLSLKSVDGYYNILLLGVDSRDMENLEGTRSDAIMVVSINEETSDVKILSVYRDTYLKMGDTYTYDKITHSCVYGGPEMTMKSLNQALDIDISNYVVVNFKAVADLVDAVGGIEVNVEDYEIQQLNKYTIETAENIGRESYNLVEESGLQTLDGCQAVSYSRIRKGVGDDFKRTERMRTVVSLTMDKMKTMSFKDIKGLIRMLTPQVQTNINMRNVLGLAFRLPQYNIIGTEGWPYYVTTGYVGGASYVFPSDLASTTIKMHQSFFGQNDYIPSDEVYAMSNQIIANVQAERDAGALEGEEEKDIDTSQTITPEVDPNEGVEGEGTGEGLEGEGTGEGLDPGTGEVTNPETGDPGTGGEGTGEGSTPGTGDSNTGEGTGSEGAGSGPSLGPSKPGISDPGNTTLQ